MISFMLISFLLSLLLIPSLLTKPNSIFHLSGNLRPSSHTKLYPVSFAYLISASKGDVGRLQRTLTALYHPANYYLLHLDLKASPSERAQLSEFISKHPTFTKIGNVWIVGKSNIVTYRGPTMLSTTLHAMAILLRSCQWDWFINLSASDYPLITQDGKFHKTTMLVFGNLTHFCNDSSQTPFTDLIVAFSKLPRDLNFIQHSSHLGWKM